MGITYSFEEWLALIDEYYASLSAWKKFKLRLRYFPVALPYYLVDLKSEEFKTWLRLREYGDVFQVGSIVNVRIPERLKVEND